MASQYAFRADFDVLGLQPDATTDIPDEAIDRQLSAASATADSYIGNRYTLPLTTWGDDLKAAVCKIAAWNLLVHYRGVSPAEPGHAAALKGSDDALSWFKDIAKGVANLSVVDTAPARPRCGVIALISTPTEDGSQTRGW